MELFQPGPVVWIQETLGPGWVDGLRLVSALGSTWGIIVVAGLAFWTWGRAALYGILAVAAADLVMKKAVAGLVAVPRPEAGPIVKYELVPGVHSFPSGHTSAATGLWAYLGWAGRIPLWVGILVGAAVGLARVYLGVHWIVDVVGAIALGLLVSWGIARYRGPIVDALERAPGWIWWMAGAALLAGSVASTFTWLSDRPIQWSAMGFIAGLGVVLPVERQWVGYRPAPVGSGARAVRIAIGLAGVVLLFLVARTGGQASLGLSAATTFLATLWALLVAPAVFARLDESAWEKAGEGEDEERPSGRGVLAWGTAGVVVLVLVAAYGSLVEPRLLLDVREERAAVPSLPAEWEGEEIALLADFQVGMWGGNDRMIERVARHVAERRPAALLVAGDFIYGPGGDPSDETRRAIRLLEPLLSARVPVYAVLGNHDWAMSQPEEEPREDAARAVERALEEAGATVLENESVALPGNGGGLYLVGVGSEWAGRARPEDAVRGLGDRPRVVIMHNPASFTGFPPGSAPLALAGHTHGGQVRLPGLPSWSWLSFFAVDEVHSDGWIEPAEGGAGNRLYINRGIGFSALPLRIRARPELTYFRLTAAPASTNPGPGGRQQASPGS